MAARVFRFERLSSGAVIHHRVCNKIQNWILGSSAPGAGGTTCEAICDAQWRQLPRRPAPATGTAAYVLRTAPHMMAGLWAGLSSTEAY